MNIIIVIFWISFKFFSPFSFCLHRASDTSDSGLAALIQGIWFTAIMMKEFPHIILSPVKNGIYKGWCCPEAMFNSSMTVCIIEVQHHPPLFVNWKDVLLSVRCVLTVCDLPIIVISPWLSLRLLLSAARTPVIFNLPLPPCSFSSAQQKRISLVGIPRLGIHCCYNCYIC